MTDSFSRRHFLRGSGALIISFSLAGCVQTGQATSITNGQATPQAPATAVATEITEQQPAASPSPAAGGDQGGDGPDPKQLDSWLAIGQDGTVTIFSGRVELGTGVRTALAQIAADELSLPFERIILVEGDTDRTPDEGYTAGSKTIQAGGAAVRNAAAAAREALLQLAAARFGTTPDNLRLQNGTITQTDTTSNSVTYGDVIGGQQLHQTIPDQTSTKDPSHYTVVGQSIQRVDLPGKIAAQPSFLQDIRLPGMLHGRVVHPPAVGATVVDVDQSSVANVAGLVQVVQVGSFVGVVAQREEQAIQTARQLQVTWTQPSNLPDQTQLADWLIQQPATDKVNTATGDVDGVLSGATNVLHATYTQPYHLHGSIGPSCAVVDVQGDQYTVYSSTQGVYQLLGALAQLVGVSPDTLHVVYSEGAGCYGHNGFDDAAGEALLLAHAVGKPVRVQWMRQDEHAWEPKGPAMVMDIRGAADDQGNVIQSMSRALFEQVTFDTSKVTSVDWRTYSIARFSDIPAVDVILINHPDQPAWGAGECSTLTTAPAIANAIYDAVGIRLRDVPLTLPGAAPRGGSRGSGR